MTDHAALQEAAGGPVSAAAAGLAAQVLQAEISLDEAFTATAHHLTLDQRVEVVAAVLTSFSPDDQSAWSRLGGRAWFREWRRPDENRTIFPTSDAGPEAALTMPWLSALGRRQAMVVLTDRDLMPEEAAQDRAELLRTDVRSFVAWSFANRAEMYGSLSLVSGEDGAWSDQLLADFRLLATALTARLTLEQ